MDAKGKSLGRLTTQVVHLLMGKHKPYFSYHSDCGDFVLVVNAEKVKITGKKLTGKVYYRYTGYLGNLKEISLKELLVRKPTEVIKKAVWGMLPKNKLRKRRIARLKIFAGENHPYSRKKFKELN